MLPAERGIQGYRTCARLHPLLWVLTWTLGGWVGGGGAAERRGRDGSTKRAGGNKTTMKRRKEGEGDKAGRLGGEKGGERGETGSGRRRRTGSEGEVLQEVVSQETRE